MGLTDILQQYAARPTSTEQDFDEVAGQVPHDVLSDGVTHAFRSEQTPPFGSIVSQLFGGGSPQLRAGLIGQLVRTLGPAVLAKLGSGAFGRFAQSGGSLESQVRPEDVRDLSPEQVREIAEEAEKKDPGVLDRVGSMAAQHPQALKILGGAALAIALGRIAGRGQR
jgi:hypothetical protein